MTAPFDTTPLKEAIHAVEAEGFKRAQPFAHLGPRGTAWPSLLPGFCTPSSARHQRKSARSAQHDSDESSSDEVGSERFKTRQELHAFLAAVPSDDQPKPEPEGGGTDGHQDAVSASSVSGDEVPQSDPEVDALDDCLDAASDDDLGAALPDDELSMHEAVGGAANDGQDDVNPDERKLLKKQKEAAHRREQRQRNAERLLELGELQLQLADVKVKDRLHVRQLRACLAILGSSSGSLPGNLHNMVHDECMVSLPLPSTAISLADATKPKVVICKGATEMLDIGRRSFLASGTAKLTLDGAHTTAYDGIEFEFIMQPGSSKSTLDCGLPDLSNYTFWLDCYVAGNADASMGMIINCGFDIAAPYLLNRVTLSYDTSVFHLLLEQALLNR
jgi:hypothetical protein